MEKGVDKRFYCDIIGFARLEHFAIKKNFVNIFVCLFTPLNNRRFPALTNSEDGLVTLSRILCLSL